MLSYKFFYKFAIKSYYYYVKDISTNNFIKFENFKAKNNGCLILFLIFEAV